MSAPSHTAVEWYPMRVTYGRQLRVRDFLGAVGVECFVPMTTRVVGSGSRVRSVAVPAISGLIFVYASRETITELKQTHAEAEPLRYMMRRPVGGAGDAPAEVITVPLRQMESFILASQAPEKEITYLRPDELKGKAGSRVQIVSGPFKGVEGTVRRIHGNRHVVVEIESVGGICIKFVPKNFMIKIE